MTRPTTSASNILRRKLCPGSEAAEHGLPEETSTDAEEGQLLHAEWQSRMTADRVFPDRPKAQLTPDQEEAVLSAVHLSNRFLESVRLQLSIPDDARVVIEAEVDLEGVVPGHADLIVDWPDHNARGIIDAKFGYLEVPDAGDNLQLAAYAVDAYARKYAAFTGVALVRPRAFGERITTAYYADNHMPPVVAELYRIVGVAREPDAPRHAGETQCRYCKAKATCPAFNAAFLAPVAAVAQAPSTVLATVTNDQLVRLHEACAMADTLASSVHAEMRARIAEERLPGWKLGNAGETRTLTDIALAFRHLREALHHSDEFTADAYMKCLSPRWTELDALVQKVADIPKKDVKQWLKAQIGHLMTTEEKAKRIMREKTPKTLQVTQP